MLKSLLFLGIIVLVSACATERKVIRLSTCSDAIGDLADCEVVE